MGKLAKRRALRRQKAAAPKPLHIKRDDEVVIIAGKDKGKSGKVLKVFPRLERIIVEKINFIKRHSRKTQQNQQGGIIEKEAPIHVSNAMLIDAKSNKRTRIRSERSGDGAKVRISARSGDVIGK
jgi:large subunit ribosomal protein L24